MNKIIYLTFIDKQVCHLRMLYMCTYFTNDHFFSNCIGSFRKRKMLHVNNNELYVLFL